MTFTLKLDGDGKPAMKDGLPLFTDPTGKAVPVDVSAIFQRAAKAEMSAAVAEAFMASKFIAEHSQMPAGALRPIFGDRFQLENGRLVGTDDNGNKLWSRQRPGELAGFDEAIEMMVGQYQHREFILKGQQERAAPQPAPQDQRAGNSVPRAVFERMSPHQAMAHIQAGGKVHD